MICAWKQLDTNRTGSPRPQDAPDSVGGPYRKQTVTERHDFINDAAHSAAQPRGATARAVTPMNERSTAMGGKMDQVKGRIKEAAGALTDDESLKREGQRDQVVGKVKEKAAKVAKKVKKTVERMADTMKNS
jgi:uncharacterized protein YjbJ (UPF0337 family)